jgi:dGTPase
MFAIDVDRILHSKAYARYIDKTQVFYMVKNSHITHRVHHVQMVSRLARTIGARLNLDLDLLEAAALGHDIGHPPFGHDGEGFLSELCQQAGIDPFVHSVMSVRFLERLEKKGKGLFLTLAVLDAVLCHDGETKYSEVVPDQGEPTFEHFESRIKRRLANPKALIRPLTREGCVVRLCDSISYVGRDLEDAMELGLALREKIPTEVTEVLGNTNGTIIFKLVEDLVSRSCNEDKLTALSPAVAEALAKLKKFNFEHIYYNPAVKREAPKIQKLYRILFERLSDDFKKGGQLPHCQKFLAGLDQNYPQTNSPYEMARDFIAGMADEYFLALATELLLPKWNIESFI